MEDNNCVPSDMSVLLILIHIVPYGTLSQSTQDGHKSVINLCLICCFCLNVSGKILNDDTPLKEYKIDEKNFVVVMVTKVSVTSDGYI